MLSGFSSKYPLIRGAVTFRTREHAFQYEKTFHTDKSADPELIARLQTAISADWFLAAEPSSACRPPLAFIAGILHDKLVFPDFPH
jgi:hypothetical protein